MEEDVQAIARDESRLDRDAYELVLAKEEMTRGMLAAQLRPLLDDGSS
jgi:hypothetical protein